MRIRWIVGGNWKMNLTLDQAQKLTRTLIHSWQSAEFPEGFHVVLCVPALYVVEVARMIPDHLRSVVQVGVQNIHSEEWGAWTGEISAPMVVSCGGTWTILGHSERRKFPFQEDELWLRQKVETALHHGLNVIFCCGETAEEKARNHAEHVVRRQVIASLFTLDGTPWQEGRIALAYEPVWAIGTGQNASPQYIAYMHRILRQELERRYGTQVAESVPILYGGSIHPENVQDIFTTAGVDGGLVGSASIQPESFLRIVEIACQVLPGKYPSRASV